MQINISNLSEGVYTYELAEEAAVIGLPENLIGIVKTDVTLAKSINQLLLTVKASVKGVFVCDRCAEDYSEIISATFNSVYSWENNEELEDDDDFHILGHDQNIIDISESVKEYLTISVPLKHLCNRRNCEIPMVIENEDASLDPRWEKLKELKKSSN